MIKGCVVIKEFEGNQPILDTKTFIAEGACLIGNVTINEFSSVWYNAVLRGDINQIEIGSYCSIQDGSVVHVGYDFPTILGDFVGIGHNAVLHGCTIGDHCLVGMGAVIMNGAVIGRGSIIAAGAVVTANQVIPPHSLVAGVPGKVIKSIPEKFDSIHSEAVKYKTLWTERYGLLPDAGGERQDVVAG